MKKTFAKDLFIQYCVTFLGISLVCFPYIYFFWLMPKKGDLGLVSGIEYTTIILLFLSFYIFIMQDVVFRAIGKVQIKNIELFILAVLFTVIFLASDFSFMGDFLRILSNFLLSPLVFGLYLIYLKFLKKNKS